MKSFVPLASFLALLPSVLAVAEWGQCGGIGYTGSTTCDSPYVCTYSNDWYSQCLPGSSTSSSKSSSSVKTSSSSTRSSSSSTRSSSSSIRSSTTSSTKSSTSTSKSSTSSAPSSTNTSCPGATKFKYFGVSESCAEFGNANIPGVLGTDYTWPSPSSIDYFVGKGFNTFRIPFLMERLSPPANGLTGSFDATYLAGLKTIVNYVTSKGAYAAIDPHNYARYNGAVITDTTAFQTWWKNLAAQFASNSLVIFDLQNEPYGITAAAAASLMQAGINGVRASGATNTIWIEGTSWTGAWSWISSGNSASFGPGQITDPLSNTVIELHQYLDSDSSGSSDQCVSSTIGVERLTAVTQWLQQNGLKAVLGEIGGGSNDTCIAAIKGALCYMQQSGVWLGALWWAAGPWWGTYFQSIEPPSGPAIARILPEALLPFV